jgi:hypothetical protein
MSNIILPTERRKATDYNPRLMVLFGKPKCGKSTLMASLEDNLIIDLEDGYRALNVMCVQARSAQDIFQIKAAIEEKNKEVGRNFYRFITIDNATRLEEMSLFYANALYRMTPMGATWGYKKDSIGNILLDSNGKKILDPKADVRLLPNGGGYLYMRKALKEMVNMFRPLCDTLILVCHVKDKQIKKNDEETTEMLVDLAGKTGDLICGEADAIGYVSRQDNKTILSFKGGENNIRGSRPLHLREKAFVVAESDDDGNLNVDMSQIFLDSKEEATSKKSVA